MRRHNAPMELPWVRELRQLHEENFFDWTSHLLDLNRRLGLAGRDEFTVPNAGLPPSWFVGDIEALQPGPWVLVISLNQARFSQATEASRRRQRDSVQKDWDYWRSLNRNDWYPRFYRPMVRLASAALGEEIPREDEPDFATTRMVFVELCPYGSGQFTFGGEPLMQLAAEDPGFQVVARVRHTLIREAGPALVMVNGAAAITTIQSLERGQLTVEEHPPYESIGRPGKILRHWEGHYRSPAASVPVLGFPFLRKPQTHNSYAEIAQLGAYGRALIERGAH